MFLYSIGFLELRTMQNNTPLCRVLYMLSELPTAKYPALTYFLVIE